MIVRRRLVATGLAAVAVGSGAAHAQTVQSLVGDRMAALDSRARALGLLRLGSAAPASSADLSAARLHLGQIVEDGIAPARTNPETAAFVDEAGKYLSDLNSLGRDPDVTPELAGIAPSFDSVRAEYAAHFKAAAIDPQRRPELTSAAQRITAREPQRRYRAVTATTGVPWFVIGALHYREASLNFMGHLHNGDFLKARTVQVPRGQPRPPEIWPPDPWDAEQAWQISAENAMRRLPHIEGKWTIERMFYAFEGYNGWGYRAHGSDGSGHPFVTPYLWNYTQWYRGGGFPADHVWLATYRSKQAGLASIIRRLSEVAPHDVEIAFEA